MYILILAILLGLVPAAIAQSKGRDFFLWWVYGAAFWIVALPHSLIMKADQHSLEARGLQNGQKKCPFCAELVRKEATVCKHCGRDLDDHEMDRSDDLQPVANMPLDVSTEKLANASPPTALEDNSERIVLGVVSAFLLFILIGGLVAAIPTAPERRLVGRTLGNAAQTSSATSGLEATLPLAPPRAFERTASQADAVSECSVIDRHGFIAFMICPSDATPAEWRREGIKACGARRVCNAWIWDSRRRAGSSLPMTDEQVNAAVAVWSNKPQTLVNCRTTGC